MGVVSLSANRRSRAGRLVQLSAAGGGGGGPFAFHRGSTSGSINTASSFTPTRPAATQVGDTMYLLFHVPNAVGSAPSIAGWSLLAGLTVSGSPKFACYTRVATVTEADTPSVSIGATTYAGWTVHSLAGTHTGAIVEKVIDGSTTHTSTSVTTGGPNLLVATMLLVGNQVDPTYVSGGTNINKSNGLTPSSQSSLIYGVQLAA